MHVEWERQANNCATADGILRPDTTAVEFHKSFADSKPQITPRFYGTRSFASLERRENRFDLGGRYPRAIVAQTGHETWWLNHNVYLNHCPDLAKLDGIFNQVEEYPSHLSTVQVDSRYPLGPLRLNVNTLAICLWAEERNTLSN
jgi:hypothetical protein